MAEAYLLIGAFRSGGAAPARKASLSNFFMVRPRCYILHEKHHRYCHFDTSEQQFFKSIHRKYPCVNATNCRRQSAYDPEYNQQDMRKGEVRREPFPMVGPRYARPHPGRIGRYADHGGPSCSRYLGTCCQDKCKTGAKAPVLISTWGQVTPYMPLHALARCHTIQPKIRR